MLFLDEPTTGFDPAARRRSWELVDRLRSLGTTILLTTHYMDEAQHLADRVAVIANGRIVATGTPSGLGSAQQETTVEFRPPAQHPLPPEIAQVGELNNGLFRASTAAPTAFLDVITTWARGRGIELEGLAVKRPTLEEIYLSLTAESESGESESGASSDE